MQLSWFLLSHNTHPVFHFAHSLFTIAAMTSQNKTEQATVTADLDGERHLLGPVMAGTFHDRADMQRMALKQEFKVSMGLM